MTAPDLPMPIPARPAPRHVTAARLYTAALLAYNAADTDETGQLRKALDEARRELSSANLERMTRP